MAKVTLLTSREIISLINDSTPSLVYSEGYKKVFQKKEENGVGIVNNLLINRDNRLKYDEDSFNKNDIDAVAELIIPDRPGDVRNFKPGVFKSATKEKYSYYAMEYPYFGDNISAKLEYLDSILEMIFEDLNNVEIQEFRVFSHDRDWGESCNGLSPEKPENGKYKNIDKLFQQKNMSIYLFQHDKFDVNTIDNSEK